MNANAHLTRTLRERETQLQAQAQAAIRAHSRGGSVSARTLDRIAVFERASFSSRRARCVAEALLHDGFGLSQLGA